MSGEGAIGRSADHLRNLWKGDLPAFGLWSCLADSTVAELLGATSFDYVCIDLQHGHATFAELPAMLQGMRGTGYAPFVRVPWNEPASVMRALDVGACGVVVPMVNSADDADRAARACRYPPTGERSWGAMWGDVREDGALPPRDQDAAVMCFVMVETRQGLDALEEIVKVPGVDGVYVGPNDLALSCGYGRANYRNSTDVDELIQHIVDTCRTAGIAVGLHCSDLEMAVHWAGRRANMLTAGQDTSLLRSGADQLWAGLAEAVGRD
jgi:4-hydroxy-2-oxoheptanedioate aldolase